VPYIPLDTITLMFFYRAHFLALLMAGIGTYHSHHAMPLNDLAIIAYFSD
jgi:hypothetical protein